MLVKGAHASIASQHHTSEQREHITSTHGGQQADHSPAAEIGAIQMHVWGRAKENKAGRSEGHMLAKQASIRHLGNESIQPAPHGGQQGDHSPTAESGGIQMHVWGRAK